MKKLLKMVGWGYIIIGGWLAVVLGASYFIGAYLSGGFAGLIATPVYWITLAIPLRGVLWLPSLLIWALSENPISFWQWLAPGLFT